MILSESLRHDQSIINTFNFRNCVKILDFFGIKILFIDLLSDMVTRSSPCQARSFQSIIDLVAGVMFGTALTWPEYRHSAIVFERASNLGRPNLTQNSIPF